MASPEAWHLGGDRRGWSTPYTGHGVGRARGQARTCRRGTATLGSGEGRWALGRDVRAAGGHTWFGSPAGVLGHLRIWGTGLTAASPRPHAVSVASVALQSWLLRVRALELPGEGQGHGQQPNPCWSRESRAFQHSARCGVFSFCPGSARPPANEYPPGGGLPTLQAPPPPRPRQRHAARACGDAAPAGVTPPAHPGT